MKTIEKVSQGVHYTAASVGAWDELNKYVVVFSPEFTVPGKVFVGRAVAATGAELSFQSFPVGGGVSFVHTHRTHEELYVVVSGSGAFQVDGNTFAVAQGSVVRVAPAGKRAIKNTGDEPLVVLCVQYKAGSFDATDATDGTLCEEPVFWL